MMRILSIALAIIVAQSIFITCQHHKLQKVTNERDNAQEFAVGRDKVARTYKNTHGVIVSENKVLKLDKENLKSLLSTHELEYLKKYDKLLNHARNLEESLNIKTSIDTTLKVVTGDTVIFSHSKGGIGVVDSVKARYFSYVDNWNMIRGVVSDSTSLEVKIQVPIDGIVYWRRPHKFLFIRWGKKEYFSEFSSDNPFVRFDDHRIIRIERRR